MFHHLTGTQSLGSRWRWSRKIALHFDAFLWSQNGHATYVCEIEYVSSTTCPNFLSLGSILRLHATLCAQLRKTEEGTAGTGAACLKDFCLLQLKPEQLCLYTWKRYSESSLWILLLMFCQEGRGQQELAEPPYISFEVPGATPPMQPARQPAPQAVPQPMPQPMAPQMAPQMAAPMAPQMAAPTPAASWSCIWHVLFQTSNLICVLMIYFRSLW